MRRLEGAREKRRFFTTLLGKEMPDHFTGYQKHVTYMHEHT